MWRISQLGRKRAALDPALAAQLDPKTRCRWCGGWHAAACPRVKALTFRSTGEPEAVEFWPWGAWPTDDVLFPTDIPAVALDEAEES